METLRLMHGGQRAADLPPRRNWRASAYAAIDQAIRAGFTIGSAVRLGHVAGHVVGYNIGAYGSYTGTGYPLLVRTEYGVAKCSLSEVLPG